MKNKTFNQKVFEIVKLIPKGYVMNYGQIARLAGNARASRAVGYALHNIDDPFLIAWHRVVFKDGSLPCFRSDTNLQYSLLRDEKVGFTKDKKVNMKKHQYDAVDIEAQLAEI